MIVVTAPIDRDEIVRVFRRELDAILDQNIATSFKLGVEVALDDAVRIEKTVFAYAKGEGD